MNLQRIFIAGFLLMAASAGGAYTLAELQRTASAWTEEWLPEETDPETRSQALVLNQAAEILSAGGDCETAFELRQHALEAGLTPDYPAWQALAQDAACHNHWYQASLAGSLAVAAADTAEQKAMALALLGKALEHRERWSRDWLPAALDAYRQSLQQRADPAIARRADKLAAALAAAEQLRVMGIEARSEGQAAEICVQFSRDMPAVDQFHYQDYIRTKPRIDAVFRLDDSQTVCFSGAAFGSRYQVRVRKGLAVGDQVLEKDYADTLTTGHRAPSLWFRNSAYVLPADDNAVPLYSINVEKTSLKLLRIHERNFLSPDVQRMFQSDVSGREIDRIRETLGELIWESEVKLNSTPDKTVHTRMKLPEHLLRTPGIYVLAASNPAAEDDYRAAWMKHPAQWLVVTDIGLSSYQGADGLLVVTRSLATAKPLPGVEVVLYARNNHALGKAVSDDRGLVRFSAGLLRGEGGRAPVQVAATIAGGGLSILSLNHAALDLSDRGVSGRPAPGPLDTFVYLERGIYRPGETFNASALLRDRQGRAVSDLPLTVRLIDPQGNRVYETRVSPGAAGSYVFTMPLSTDARTGKWTLRWYADSNDRSIGEADFLVAAIRPPRMRAKLDLQGVLRAQESLTGRLQAEYLFGAAATERPVDLTLKLGADPEPFADYPGYRFLPAATGERVWQSALPEQRTDARGEAEIDLEVDEEITARYPLRATLTAEVRDVDGRTVQASASVAYRHLPFYIGVRPEFDGNRVAANGEAGFRVMVLDGKAKPARVKGLQWRLLKLEQDYQWFRKGGEWGYEAITRERVQQQGKLAATGKEALVLRTDVARGRYRLEVFHAGKGLLSSIDFLAGSAVQSIDDTPDAVTLTLDKPVYRAGESAELQVQAPYAGQATLVISTDRVLQVQHFDLSAGKASVPLRVEASWGAGAYALVTVYRPGKAAYDAPERAMGIVWVDVDAREQQLQVAIEAPESVLPRQRVEIPVRIRDPRQGEKVHLTLAAVDVGVLDITGFQTPDPVDYFFGKRQLGTAIRDLYGQLIRMPGQKPGQLRSGAGTSGRRGTPMGNIRVLSRFSGRIEVDEQGVAHVPLSLPDFNGRLRLMVVAWSDTGVGAADAELLVREPLVLSPSLPRFLTVDDHGEMNLLLRNLGAPAGEYLLTVTSEDDLLSIDFPPRRLSLQTDASQSVRVPLQAMAPGHARVRIEIRGPEGYQVGKQVQLGIRGKALPVVRREFQRLAAKKELRLEPDLFEEFYPDTANLQLTLASEPGLDIPGLLKQLDRYPYGCLEQLTSRAFPLLYVNELAERWQLDSDPALSGRVAASIRKILQKQQGNGGFGLWSGWDEIAIWPSLYALEFLLSAREAGVEVPDYALDRGLEWIEQSLLRSVGEAPQDLANQAYAHFVLALAGRARSEELRYLADTQSENLPGSLAAAHLATALALNGQRDHARRLFKQALKTFYRDLGWEDYGSDVRDLAAMISLLQRAGSGYGDPAGLFSELAHRQQRRKWFSTQEQAWMVLAGRSLKPGKSLQWSIDGRKQKAASKIQQLRMTAGDLGKGKRIRNLGKQPLWVTSTLMGMPKSVPQDPDNQFSVTREVYGLDGNPVDLRKLRPGDVLITVLRGEALSGQEHPALLVDLLPGGLEAENSRLLDGFDGGELDWLPELSETRYTDLLDDRFVAALDVPRGRKGKKQRFALAYMIRVVTPGEYWWPAVEVEDMYRPYYRARGQGERIEILSP